MARGTNLESPDDQQAWKTIAIYIQGRSFNSFADNMKKYQFTKQIGLTCYLGHVSAVILQILT